MITRKNIALRFHACARELVTRNPIGAKKFMGRLYGIGDTLVFAVPFVRNGFFDSALHLHPHWHSIPTAFSHDPVPMCVSLLFIASAAALNRNRFALANIGWGAGSGVLVANLAMHHEPWTAALTLFSVAGGAVGAFYKQLEYRFGHSQNRFVQKIGLNNPQRLASRLFMATSIPTVGTALFEKIWPLAVSGVLWSVSNYAGLHLPRDDEAPDVPPSKGKLSSSPQAAKLNKT